MCIHRTQTLLFPVLHKEFSAWKYPHLREGPRKRTTNKIIVKKQNFKVAASRCLYVRDRYVPAKHDICWAVAGFLSKKGTEES